LRNWTNWRDWMRMENPDTDPSFDRFMIRVKEVVEVWTPEKTEEETGVSADQIREIGRAIGEARGAFASHVWRNAASGNRGGWQVARCLQLLTVLTGSVGTPGGTFLHSDNKFVAAPFSKPPPQDVWNELLYPQEWPMSHHELSFLLPHLLRDGRGKLDTYFSRVYNPVWTNPDGCMWMDVLADESLVGCHVALTPTWNETTLFADWVLPMGVASERHDSRRPLGGLPPAGATRGQGG